MYLCNGGLIPKDWIHLCDLRRQSTLSNITRKQSKAQHRCTHTFAPGRLLALAYASFLFLFLSLSEEKLWACTITEARTPAAPTSQPPGTGS